MVSGSRSRDREQRTKTVSNEAEQSSYHLIIQQCAFSLIELMVSFSVGLFLLSMLTATVIEQCHVAKQNSHTEQTLINALDLYQILHHAILNAGSAECHTWPASLTSAQLVSRAELPNLAATTDIIALYSESKTVLPITLVSNKGKVLFVNKTAADFNLSQNDKVIVNNCKEATLLQITAIKSLAQGAVVTVSSALPPRLWHDAKIGKLEVEYFYLKPDHETKTLSLWVNDNQGNSEALLGPIKSLSVQSITQFANASLLKIKVSLPLFTATLPPFTVTIWSVTRH